MCGKLPKMAAKSNNTRSLKLKELKESFESRENINLEAGGSRILLPGPLTARPGPLGSYYFQFHGDGLIYMGITFRGGVKVDTDGTVTGDLAEALQLDPASEEGRSLRKGTEVMISSKGILQSKDTYLIEGDCNAKKCALSRDLVKDPL